MGNGENNRRAHYKLTAAGRQRLRPSPTCQPYAIGDVDLGARQPNSLTGHRNDTIRGYRRRST
jgi:hypothetical protein